MGLKHKAAWAILAIGSVLCVPVQVTAESEVPDATPETPRPPTEARVDVAAPETGAENKSVATKAVADQLHRCIEILEGLTPQPGECEMCVGLLPKPTEDPENKVQIVDLSEKEGEEASVAREKKKERKEMRKAGRRYYRSHRRFLRNGSPLLSLNKNEVTALDMIYGRIAAKAGLEFTSPITPPPATEVKEFVPSQPDKAEERPEEGSAEGTGTSAVEVPTSSDGSAISGDGGSSTDSADAETSAGGDGTGLRSGTPAGTTPAPADAIPVPNMPDTGAMAGLAPTPEGQAEEAQSADMPAAQPGEATSPAPADVGDMDAGDAKPAAVPAA